MPTPSPAPTLAASWFDGRSTRARSVLVNLHPSRGGPRLQLRALDDGQTLDLAYDQVGWPERWSAGRVPPRLTVDLGEHGSLQIEEPLAWQTMLANSGRRTPLAERMQTQLKVLLAVLLIASVGIWAFYRWGTPWAATQIARHVPLAWELALSERAMKEIDEAYVKPTKLAPERQAELREGFSRLKARIDKPLRLASYIADLKLQRLLACLIFVW